MIPEGFWATAGATGTTPAFAAAAAYCSIDS